MYTLILFHIHPTSKKFAVGASRKFEPTFLRVLWQFFLKRPAVAAAMAGKRAAVRGLRLRGAAKSAAAPQLGSDFFV